MEHPLCHSACEQIRQTAELKVASSDRSNTEDSDAFTVSHLDVMPLGSAGGAVGTGLDLTLATEHWGVRAARVQVHSRSAVTEAHVSIQTPVVFPHRRHRPRHRLSHTQVGLREKLAPRRVVLSASRCLSLPSRKLSALRSSATRDCSCRLVRYSRAAFGCSREKSQREPQGSGWRV